MSEEINEILLEAANNHPIVKEMAAIKKDQVAAILTSGMRGWLYNPNCWVNNCEVRYDRHDKGRKVTFSIFSNGGDLVGEPVRERPFFQVEIDTFTKKLPMIKDIPLAFGLCPSIMNRATLRDIAYPYLWLITVLIRNRGYIPTALYFDEGEDRPLQLEMIGGRSVWRVMLWQNRLINEYNELIKKIPELYSPDDGQYERLVAMRDNLGHNEEIIVDMDSEGLERVDSLEAS